jgi:tartrate-resistant acid phosphatase type 5
VNSARIQGLIAALLLSCVAACRREPPKPPAVPAPAPTIPDLAPAMVDVCGATRRADRGDNTAPVPADLAATDTQTAHFLAFGDSGTGDPSQFRVAAAMIQFCQAHPCQFALHTGDILYPQGVISTTDPRLKERFEGPYAPLGVPIWMSLGNHDYYPPADPEQAIAYTQVSPSKAWRLPARWYTFLEHGVRFLALDTNQPNAEQETWARQVLAESRRNRERWVVAFGHHPRLSDSRHGNASGEHAAWLDRVLCHRVDLLVSGHDHVLEVLKPRCGFHQIVTGGGGADLYGLTPGDNGAFEAQSFGFVHMDATATSMQAQFVNDHGKALCDTAWQKFQALPTCGKDAVCNGLCAKDPDCLEESCARDGRCNFACTDDSDCEPAGACTCDRDPLICEVRVPGSNELCACDAGCQVTPIACAGDGVCDRGCKAGSDPDCQ